jgi:hypothetical protein
MAQLEEEIHNEQIKLLNTVNYIHDNNLKEIYKFSYIYNLNGQEKSLYFDINQHIF